jgi:hypothetical protein
MAHQIDKIINPACASKKTLRLLQRFKISYTPPPHQCALVLQLSLIIDVLSCAVNSFWNKLSMEHAVVVQFDCHYILMLSSVFMR